jgi:hypothetical protein
LIEISYTLHTGHGDILYEMQRMEHIPRVDDLITFEHTRSYQVIDVLWHLGPGSPSVTITAHELSWHQHIKDVAAEWGQRQRRTAAGEE